MAFVRVSRPTLVAINSNISDGSSLKKYMKLNTELVHPDLRSFIPLGYGPIICFAPTALMKHRNVETTFSTTTPVVLDL